MGFGTQNLIVNLYMVLKYIICEDHMALLTWCISNYLIGLISCQNNYQYFNILLGCVNIVFTWKTVDWLVSVWKMLKGYRLISIQVASICEYLIINSREYLEYDQVL